MMALAKGIIGMIAMKNAFIFQVAFSGLVRVSKVVALLALLRHHRLSSDLSGRIETQIRINTLGNFTAFGQFRIYSKIKTAS